MPIGTFVSVARSAIRALGHSTCRRGAVGALASLLEIEENLQAAEEEQRAVSATKEAADQRIAEMRDNSLDLFIAHPQPASAITGSLTVRLRIPSGSAALLANAGLSQRRVFVWVNEEELSLAHARIRVELPQGVRNLPDLRATPQASEHPKAEGGRVGYPSTRARAERHDVQRKERLISRTTSLTITRFSNRRFAAASLPRLPTRSAFPPRVPRSDNLALGAANDRPVLVVEIDVPESMMHEGLNALACTLVPGAVQRRVERAVSFLYVPGKPAAAERPTMPGKPASTHLPAALADVLTARGIAPSRAPRVSKGAPQVRLGTWVAPLDERKKKMASSHAKLNKELAAVATQYKEMREAIATGALRPKQMKMSKKGDPI